MDTFQTFIDILKNTEDLVLRVNFDKITKEHKLIEDLGVDSLTRVTIFFEIQDHFEIDDAQEEAQKWLTVKDILLYMDSKK